MADCIFCKEAEEISKKALERALMENDSFFGTRDPNPVSDGHGLIIPKRHVEKIISLNRKECLDYFDALEKIIECIGREYNPDGYNIGINQGRAAGQTEPHLHTHVIPRYEGDVKDPVGGVRNIIPGKGRYSYKKKAGEGCVFCREYRDASAMILYEINGFWTKFSMGPVSKGHALIIPKRHIESILELNQKECFNFFSALEDMIERINEEYNPDGYNIGINQGKAAGQTIPHLHIHVIPRYEGDVKDPVGGVRNIIPGKGNYLKKKD